MSTQPIHIDADIRKASTLPAEVYSDPARFEQARRRIFARSWQIVGHTSLIRTPRQTLPFMFLSGCVDEPLLLTRDAGDQLHCLSNVCTHRANLVCEHAGEMNQLRCRYHGRRFDLSGAFRAMPEFEGAECFPTDKDNLPRIKMEQFGPFLFAAIDPVFSFDELLRPMRDRIGWLPLDEFIFDASRSREYLVAANWALYCDNYLEGLHIPFVHASLSDELDADEYTVELSDYSSLQLGVAKDGQHCFDLPASSPDHGADIAAYYFWLFPNMMFNFYPWGLSINIVTPLAPDRTRIAFRSYVWRQSLLAQGAGADLDRVEREDEAVVESVQRGVQSRLYDRGRFSPSREQGVHHFHRLIARFLNGDSSTP